MFSSLPGLSGILWVILALLAAWVATLTGILVRTIRHYRRLTGNTHINLEQVLNRLLDSQNEHSKTLENIARQLSIHYEDNKLHIQHIGFVRFNPFEETGGDQSFVAAFLNDYKDGLVISSLHTRSGTRLYAKAVKAGKGVKYTLSKEEEEAVGNAYA